MRTVRKMIFWTDNSIVTDQNEQKAAPNDPIKYTTLQQMISVMQIVLQYRQWLRRSFSTFNKKTTKYINFKTEEFPTFSLLGGRKCEFYVIMANHQALLDTSHELLNMSRTASPWYDILVNKFWKYGCYGDLIMVHTNSK